MLTKKSYTTKQAAKLCGKSIPQINLLIRKGKLKAEKADPDCRTSANLIERESLENYLQSISR